MYRRTQTGTLTIVLLGVAAAMTSGIALMNLGHSILLGAPLLCLVVLVLFRSLTIEIDATEVRCYFGDGLIRRSIHLDEIVSAETVRTPWYYGWGIRWIPSGWMFNVSGFDGVELLLKSGKRFRMGTDVPNDVLLALRSALGKAKSKA